MAGLGDFTGAFGLGFDFFASFLVPFLGLVSLAFGFGGGRDFLVFLV